MAENKTMAHYLTDCNGKTRKHRGRPSKNFLLKHPEFKRYEYHFFHGEEWVVDKFDIVDAELTNYRQQSFGHRLFSLP
jgi:hypothetical protein